VNLPYREVAQQSFGYFATLSPKGSAASAPPNIGGMSDGRGGFAPPNIGGMSDGRGGFAALRIPHAYSNTSILACSFLPS